MPLKIYWYETGVLSTAKSAASKAASASTKTAATAQRASDNQAQGQARQGGGNSAAQNLAEAKETQVAQQEALKGRIPSSLTQQERAEIYGGRYTDAKGNVVTVGQPTTRNAKGGHDYAVNLDETLSFSDRAELERESKTKSGGLSTVKTTRYQYDDEGEVVGVKQQEQSQAQKFNAVQPSESPAKTFDKANVQGGRDIGVELNERMGFAVVLEDDLGSSNMSFDIYGEASSPKLNKVKGSKQSTEQVITPSLLFGKNNYLGLKGASPKFVNEKGEPMIQAYTSPLGITTSIGESQNIPRPLEKTSPPKKESKLDNLLGKNINLNRQYETMKAGLSGYYKVGVEVASVGVATLKALSPSPNFKTSPASEVVQSKKISATERGTIEAEKFIVSANIPKYPEGSLEAKQQMQGEFGASLLLFSGVNAVGEAGAGVIGKIGAKGVKQVLAEAVYKYKSESSQLKVVQDIAKRVQKDNPNSLIGIERLTEAKKGVGVQYQITIGSEGRQTAKTATSEYKGQNSTPEGELFGAPKFAKPTETPLESILTVERKTDLLGATSVSAKQSKIPEQVISSMKGEASKGEGLIVDFTPSRNYGSFKVQEIHAGEIPPSNFLSARASEIYITGKIGKGTQEALNLQGVGKKYTPSITEDKSLMRSFKEQKFNDQIITARTSMDKGEYFGFTTKEGLTTQGQKLLEGAKKAKEYKPSYYSASLSGKDYLAGDIAKLDAFRKGTTHKAEFTEYGWTKAEKGLKEWTGIKGMKEESPINKMSGFDKKTGLGKYSTGKSKTETITVKTDPEFKQFSKMITEKAKAEKEILFTDPRFKSTGGITGMFVPTGHELKQSKKDESRDILFSGKRFEERKRKKGDGEVFSFEGGTRYPEEYGTAMSRESEKLYEDVNNALRVKVGRGTKSDEKLGFSDKLSWSVIPAIAQGLIPAQITKEPQKTITPQKQGLNLKSSLSEKLNMGDKLVTRQGTNLKLDLYEKLRFGDGLDTPLDTPLKPPIPLVPKEPPPIPAIIPTGFWSLGDYDVPSKDLGERKGFFGNVPVDTLVGIYGKKADITYSEGSGFRSLTGKGKVKKTKPQTYTQGLTKRSYNYELGKPQTQSNKYKKLGGGILSSIGGNSNLRSRKGNKYKLI